LSLAFARGPGDHRAMSKIMLKLRDLKSGKPSVREFDDEAQTISFLKERPAFTDVLGVVFEGLTPEQNARLRAAMRPLDPTEVAAERALDEAAAKEAETAAELRAKEDEKQRAAHREALKNADPNRTMEVRYLYNAPLALVDGEDPREISAEAREAVAAWVAERNEWVDSRGQIVGEAKITLWPGALPKPNADRVVSGTFIPVTAPPKPKSDAN
jgi:hypothetical protein